MASTRARRRRGVAGDEQALEPRREADGRAPAGPRGRRPCGRSGRRRGACCRRRASRTRLGSRRACACSSRARGRGGRRPCRACRARRGAARSLAKCSRSASSRKSCKRRARRATAALRRARPSSRGCAAGWSRGGAATPRDSAAGLRRQVLDEGVAVTSARVGAAERVHEDLDPGDRAARRGSRRACRSSRRRSRAPRRRRSRRRAGRTAGSARAAGARRGTSGPCTTSASPARAAWTACSTYARAAPAVPSGRRVSASPWCSKEYISFSTMSVTSPMARTKSGVGST